MSKDTGIKALKGAYGPEDPPLPIPNREVKLRSADGTAPRGGRVGRRRIPGVPVTTQVAGTFLFYTDSCCEMRGKAIGGARVCVLSIVLRTGKRFREKII